MVPEGWHVGTLEELTSKGISYGIVQTGESGVGEIPCVRVVDLTKEHMSPGDMITTTEEISRSYRKTVLEPDEIMLALRGEIGLVRMVSDDLVGCNLTRGIARIAADRTQIHPQYLLWALRSSSFRRDLMRRVNGSALQEIPLGELRKVLLFVPPLIEQRKIAEILSTWDRAIDTVEKLIENGEQQRKALMQRLLRPEAGSDQWARYKLADIAEILISNVDKKSADGEEHVRLCNYTDVYYNDYITSDLNFMVATASPAQIRKFKLRKGDILITKDSETPDDIAVPAMVDSDLDGVVCGYHLAIVRPKESVDAVYLRSLFALDVTQHYFLTRANGATRFGLTIDAIKDSVFSFPPLSKQRRAAQMIRSAEKVVRVHEADLSRLRGEKTALMQQLLTGKRRVKVDSDVDRIVSEAGAHG